ncbi:excitatory amino acid transporter 3 [Nothobranchius furzeri]|uniref:excitatory amino acid transporter 3 n=1 Tax=Nothobranchius furzeri TaxID=105023 RepID=UPI003904631C
MVEPAAERKWRAFTSYVKENNLIVASLVAVVLGIVLGVVLKTYVILTDEQQEYIKFPGEILMRMLQFVSVPLITTSVTLGVAGLSINTSRHIAFRATLYFTITTLVAVTIGLILAVIIRPGAVNHLGQDFTGSNTDFSTIDALLDLGRNMVPPDFLQACFQQYQTDKPQVFEGSNSSQNYTADVPRGHYVDGANTLGLIAFAFVLGLAINSLKKKKENVLVLVAKAINDITKAAVNLILRFLPVGVFFMITTHVLEVRDWQTTENLGKFIAVVLTGLIIHGAIVLPMIYILVTRQNPLKVIRGVSPALLTALLIASSSATLPHTLRCCLENNKIDGRIVRFMLPIGTNVNMDGSALYEAAAAVFIAQLSHIYLDVTQLFIIGLAAAIASVGAAGIPATGAVTTLFVLTAVGLPVRDAALLVVTEWLLDRFSTVINVFGDCIGVSLVHEMSRQELEKMDKEDMETGRILNKRQEMAQGEKVMGESAAPSTTK